MEWKMRMTDAEIHLHSLYFDDFPNFLRCEEQILWHSVFIGPFLFKRFGILSSPKDYSLNVTECAEGIEFLILLPIVEKKETETGTENKKKIPPREQRVFQ